MSEPVDWWGKVRNAWIWSAHDRATVVRYFEELQAIGEGLVIRESQSGHGLVYFPTDAAQARRLEAMGLDELPVFGVSWLQVGGRAPGTIWVSFEEAVDSESRKRAVSAVLAKLGSFEITFEP